MHDKKTGQEIEQKPPPSIGVVEDPALGFRGPLWIHGGITRESADGIPHEVRSKVTLCRCGMSVNKPFCNGSHASIKFKDGLAEFVRQNLADNIRDLKSWLPSRQWIKYQKRFLKPQFENQFPKHVLKEHPELFFETANGTTS